jgi:putative ABC transport system permease protein
MFRSYLQIAFRNILKRRAYSLMNIAGLATGIACCLLIFQYVSYEKSYDSFQKDASRIVRLRLDQYKQGKLEWQSATVYPAIAPALKKDYPEVENFCRLHVNANVLANAERKVKFNETKGYYADPAALSMLGIQLTKGNPATALNGVNSMVISESLAKKYFGNGDPVGKRLEIRESNAPANTTYEIAGVFRDYPKNSHLRIDYLVSYATLASEQQQAGDTTNATETSFGWYDFYTYLQLKPGTDIKVFESKLPFFCERYINSQDWNRTNNAKDWLSVIPLSDIHLQSNYNQEAEVNGDGKAVNFMFLIGIVIMLIAWINYINLSTARAVERGKEVGVRKVLGAIRTQLIRQFMMESSVLNVAGLLIGLFAAFLLSKQFDQIMGSENTGPFRLAFNYVFIFGLLFLSGTLLSGLYPAFVLSAFKPVVILKGAFKNSSKGQALRKGLIVLQFSISIILIAGTIIVYRQVKFMRQQELGANINQTIVLDGVHSIRDSLYNDVFQPFKNELLQQPGVKSMAASTEVPGREIYWTNGVKKLDAINSHAVTLYHLGIDEDFIPQYQIKMLAGRNFSKGFKTDEKAAILNEKAVAALGFKDPQEALNQRLLRGQQDSLHIVGVVQNFHQVGLQKLIDPEILLWRPSTRNAYSIKVQTGNLSQTIAGIKATWDKHFPNDPFNYYFLDEAFDKQYKADQRFGQVFSLFSLLAIVIACFGLFGLSSYNIFQRTKELGIRKVLGASTRSVIYLLSKDFVLLILVSIAFSIPVSWWLMHKWLENFAYRIAVSWWVFLLAAVVAVGIALFTISFQSLKAAYANPVKNLRSE